MTENIQARTRTGSGRCILEGNLIELPSVLIPNLPQPSSQRRWMVLDVLAVVTSLAPVPPGSLGDWEIRTTLSEIAKWLGTSRGGKKLKHIKESLEYLGNTELEFPNFLSKENGQSKHGLRRFKVFKKLEINRSFTNPRKPVTIKIQLADELTQNLKANYFKSTTIHELIGLRHTIGKQSHLAVPLYLYLDKKNKPEWVEEADKIHQKLNIPTAYKPWDARARVLKAAQALKGAGKILNFEYLPEKNQYKFELRRR